MKLPVLFRRALGICPLIFTLLVAAGCSSLPNVSPFVVASSQLRGAVASSGQVVVTELNAAKAVPPDRAKKLATAWDARNKAFSGMVDYANSLQGIVDAGNSGAESAGQLADSVANLADAAGIVIPGSPAAVEAGTEIAKFISKQIAIARAAKSLESSLVAVQPAIQSITTNIIADISDLETVMIFANTLVKNDLVKRYSDQLGYRLSLQNVLGTNLITAAGVFSVDDKAKLDQQVKVSALLANTDEWYAEYEAQLNKILERKIYALALLDSVRRTTKEWSVAHEKLVIAVKERKPVSIESLTQSAFEIEMLVRKVREL
jgi:hypothetical protein